MWRLRTAGSWPAIGLLPEPQFTHLEMKLVVLWFLLACFFEMGSHSVSQDGPELLEPGGPPISACQVSGTIGVSPYVHLS